MVSTTTDCLSTITYIQNKRFALLSKKGCSPGMKGILSSYYMLQTFKANLTGNRLEWLDE
jgi:hypothetical protein